jgi:hypothetical protein
MRIRFDRFFRNLRAIGSFAFNILQLISALIGIIVATSIGTALLAFFLHLRDWIVPLSTFILGIAITLILIIYYVWRSSPPRWLLRGYRHIRWESLYEIHEDDLRHHTFFITVEIEAIQPGIHIFEDTYQWTGKGREEVPKVVSQGHTLMNDVVQRSAWNYYYIHLGHDLNVGERTTVQLVQELYDSENQFQPFLAKIISQPIDLLILRVKLPVNHLVSNIRFTEYSTVGPASEVVKSTPGTINNQTGEIHWRIISPVFGHRYEITWK